MVKTSTLSKWLKEQINKFAEKENPEGYQYTFKVWTEVRQIKGVGSGTTVEGRLHKNTSNNIPTAGFNSSMAEYSLDFFVATPQGTNGHLLNVKDILDDFVAAENGTYHDMNGGRALFIFDDSIAQNYLENYNGCDDYVVLTLSFSAQWTPDVLEDTAEIKEGQIEIKLINRTPYHNRKIDMNEEDKVVLKLNTTIVGWTHNEVSAVLKIKLPTTFVAEYTYAQITEFNGKVTRWFVLGRQYDEPQVWTLTLKRDVIRENWDKLKDATCLVERGYIDNGNPLFYRQENISGNTLLGKRTKLLDSNLLLVYVKTFQAQINGGAAIPEGYWKVQAGMPGFNNAPIITETIPDTIRLYGSIESVYLKLYLFWYRNAFGDVDRRYLDCNGQYGSAIYEPNNPKYSLSHTSIGSAGTGFNSAPKQEMVVAVKDSREGYLRYINEKQSLNLQQVPDWMKLTGGFDNDYPAQYECVVNTGTADNPSYYKLIFEDNIKFANQNIGDSYASQEDINKFVEYAGNIWNTPSLNNKETSGNIVIGSIQYHEYTIKKQFLSNNKPNENACYTEFPATSIQTTAGAYSYNIYAFKVFDDGKSYVGGNEFVNNGYLANAISGQMIASALMGTGTGLGATDNDGAVIPSLSGQIVDIQLSPFNENSIKNLIDKVYPIYAGATSKTKVGEYYLLNSQDVEQFVNYDLSDWRLHGNEKSRLSLSEMRLVCPNNSSMATLQPDIMTKKTLLRFKINGTMYPYKPIYKVTPVADSNIVYPAQDARDNMLVLGGDFSATQVSSAWSDYLIGNKNVEEVQQASIANQVLNQQLQYNYQTKALAQNSNLGMMSSLLGIAGGVIGFSTANPMLGMMGLLGGLFGIKNTKSNTDLQQEQLQINQAIFNNNIALNQKLFSLNLGNIKAMPNTIHKITSGSFDNDYSVMVEEYYSTPTEYEQFNKAIKQTGMTVDCIGILGDYINPEYNIVARTLTINIENYSVVSTIDEELETGLKIIIPNSSNAPIENTINKSG